MTEKKVIEMTDENRPYIEALTRMTLGIRDRDAEQVILDGIQELIELRHENAHLREMNTRMTPIIKDFARFGIGGFMPAYHVADAEAIVKAMEQEAE